MYIGISFENDGYGNLMPSLVVSSEECHLQVYIKAAHVRALVDNMLNDMDTNGNLSPEDSASVKRMRKLCATWEKEMEEIE